jgi:predicted ATPase
MEMEYPLDPLPQAAAVRLFLDGPRPCANAEPSAEVEEICRRLDGLPLALETAAARRSCSTRRRAHAARLAALAADPRPTCQTPATLEATIAWSYDLLVPEAGEVFLQLAPGHRRRGGRGR